MSTGQVSLSAKVPSCPARIEHKWQGIVAREMLHLRRAIALASLGECGNRSVLLGVDQLGFALKQCFLLSDVEHLRTGLYSRRLAGAERIPLGTRSSESTPTALLHGALHLLRC